MGSGKAKSRRRARSGSSGESGVDTDVGDDAVPRTAKGEEVSGQNAELRKAVYGHISKYVKPRYGLPVWDLVTSVVFICIALKATDYCTSWFTFLPMVALCALLRMRLFILFHDAAHHSCLPHGPLFPESVAKHLPSGLAKFTTSEAMCAVITPIVFTSYRGWSRGHNYHHKHSNNLDRKQYSQTSAWTKAQFDKAPWYGKVLYTFFYGPLTLWTFVPALTFWFLFRIQCTWWENTLWFLWQYFRFYSWTTELWVTCAGAWLGFFMFHSQHTFSGSYKRYQPEWDYFENGMKGSSFLQVPWFLRYFTLGIEYHHIHHLNARVPYFELARCHDESGDLFKDVPRTNLWEVVKSLPFSLYNSENEMFEIVYSSF